MSCYSPIHQTFQMLNDQFDIQISSTINKNLNIILKQVLRCYFDPATWVKYMGVFVTAWRTKVGGQKNILRPVELGSLCLSVMIPLGVINAWYKKLCRLCSFAEAPWYSFRHGVTDILGVDSKIPPWAPIIVKFNFFFFSCLWETFHKKPKIMFLEWISSLLISIF